MHVARNGGEGKGKGQLSFLRNGSGLGRCWMNRHACLSIVRSFARERERERKEGKIEAKLKSGILGQGLKFFQRRTEWRVLIEIEGKRYVY